MIFKSENPVHDLESMAALCAYSPRIALIEEELRKTMMAYDKDYGPYLTEHLKRTSEYLDGFLAFLGYDRNIAYIIARAALPHDSGKTEQPGLWIITEEKRPRTDMEKIERPKHAQLGVTALNKAVDRLGIEADLTQSDCRYLDLMSTIMVRHHDRIKTDPALDRILQIIGIVDTADGKLKAKIQSADHDQRSALGLAIEEMISAEKHRGEFDPDLLNRYREYCYEEGLALKPANGR